MLVYSLALTLGLAAAAPWWIWRMATSGRYRQGLAGRLGQMPKALKQACAGKRVVWVHAVSVGEVLAVARLVEDLRKALGHGWLVAVSTTTATGQKIARERLGAATVFWFPLDFAFAVRACLRALKPELLVLVESELWPRMLWECERAGVPVAVVNARASDRSFARTKRVRGLWLQMARHVQLWLAQGQETAGRLRELGVSPDRIRTPGNLKYDAPDQPGNAMAARIRLLLGRGELIIAGSTLPGEERLLIDRWPRVLQANPGTVLLLAPRHPERFAEVTELVKASEHAFVRCSRLAGVSNFSVPEIVPGTVLILDTLGDLASLYAVGAAAFIGGSLVPRGGHNPLEAARFGVPVVMGPSYENFREIVDGMRAAEAIRIADAEGLADVLIDLLAHGEPMGERGRRYFDAQAGATERTVAALLELMHA